MRSVIVVIAAVAAVAVPSAVAQRPPEGALSLESAAPNPVIFGGTVTIHGEVGGSGKRGGQQVDLQAKPAPFTADFRTIATATTKNNGRVTFAVKPDRHTRYRLRMQATVSREVQINVRLRAGFLVSDRTPASGTVLTFRGTVWPEHDGKPVRIQRRGSDARWRTLKTVTSTDVAGRSYSAYRTQVRVRVDARFRVRALSGDVDHFSGTSRSILVDVH